MFKLLLWIAGPLSPLLYYRAQAARQTTLLWTLAVAVEKQLPLVPFLEALADEATGKWRSTLRGMAGLLHSGSSIPDALEAVPGLLPAETVAAIRIGAESGRLAPALRETAERYSRRCESVPTEDGSGIGYLCGLLFAMLMVITFVGYWIVPKYKAIFAGFDTRLPELTITVIEVMDFAIKYYYLFVLLVGPAIVVVLRIALQLAAWSAGAIGAPRWLTWLLPRLQTPLLLRSLGLAVDGGRPLTGALAVLTARHPDIAFRRRLAQVEESVTLGADCWQGLYSAGLLRRGEVAVLEAAQRVGNLGWALRGVADSVERRSEQRLRILRELLRPVGLLMAGTVVAFFVIGMFLPVVKLISDFPIEGAGR
jgi:type II secretory pathway component PulF